MSGRCADDPVRARHPAMTERTERDDVIDRAIEYLIDVETDGFVVVAFRGGEVELVNCEADGMRPVEVMLVAQYVLNAALRSLTGGSMSEREVFGAGVAAADEFGYADVALDPGPLVEGDGP